MFLPESRPSRGPLMRWAVRLVVMVLLLLLIGLGWLVVSPPELIRVGSAYAAKVVCSNVFLAGRPAPDVLRDDVQAPGHPVLRLMQVAVDEPAQRVSARLLGLAAPGVAVMRPGTGCAVVPDGDEAAARVHQFSSPSPAASAPALAPWPEGDAAVSTPPPALARLLADAAMTGPGVRAVLVVHRGRLLASTYAPGFGDQTPLLGWSMSKTVTATLIGRLQHEGRLSLDDHSLWAKADPVDPRHDIGPRELLAMSSGLAFNEGYGAVSDATRMLYLEPDMAAFAHRQPLARPVGQQFSYSSGSSMILSRWWQSQAGPESLSYPQRALFAPLGLRHATLEADARGNLVGSSYLYASAPDWARLGQFLLQDGVWRGQRLLPEGWVASMTTPTASSQGRYAQGHLWREGPRVSRAPGAAASAAEPNDAADFQLPPDTWWMLGHDGQSIAVVPSRQLIVVRLGLTPSRLGWQPQPLLKAVLGAVE